MAGATSAAGKIVSSADGRRRVFFSVRLSALRPTLRRKICSCGKFKRSIAAANGSHSTALMSSIGLPAGPPIACMRQKCAIFGPLPPR